MRSTVLRLALFAEVLAVCRLDPTAEVPAWATQGDFWSLTRTRDELSIVCHDHLVPSGVACEHGWRAIRVVGDLDFESVGILDAIASPLAVAGISILPIATYTTDYVLVRESQLERAVSVLSERGHRIRQ